MHRSVGRSLALTETLARQRACTVSNGWRQDCDTMPSRPPIAYRTRTGRSPERICLSAAPSHWLSTCLPAGAAPSRLAAEQRRRGAAERSLIKERAGVYSAAL